MGAINLTTQFAPKVAERFSLSSLTDSFAGSDFEFSGAKTLKIYTVDTVPIDNYQRSGLSRYGTLTELGDTVQELTMSQDKGFTFSIDAGNASDQLNIKQVSRRLKANWDEVATPLIDKYRFEKWANGAGITDVNTAALTKDTIMNAIMSASAGLSNALVPLKNRALFIRESLYVAVKLANELVGIDSLGEQAIKTGVVGMIDGMKIVRVPDSYLPSDVNFIIKYKDATADPMKLKSLRVQKTPMGIDGDVGECRFYFDAFVLDAKINGVYASLKNGVATPTFSGTSSITISCSTSGAAIRYTTDKSNPKTSATAQSYSSALASLPAGTVIRAYAHKAGSTSSGVATYTV